MLVLPTSGLPKQAKSEAGKVELGNIYGEMNALLSVSKANEDLILSARLSALTGSARVAYVSLDKEHRSTIHTFAEIDDSDECETRCHTGWREVVT